MSASDRRGWLDPALRTIGRGALGLSSELEQVGAKTRQAAGNLLAQLMSPEEREAFSVSRYSASVWEPRAKDGLRSWENEWFAMTLPPPPARLLVAACGTGREVLSLLAQGFEVDAFDGAPGALAVAHKECAGRARIVEATYRDLVTTTLEGAVTPLSSLAKTRYDAVLLGWGSLTHVSGSKERGRVLRACAILTEGPILTSFYSAPPEEQKKSEEDRWVRWGRALGKKLKLPPGPAYIEFSHWGGFAEYLTKEELALHGAALHRRVEWDEGNSASFPHVTLRKRVL